MYDKRFIANAIERSAETAVDRRKLLTIAGLAGAGAAAAAFLRRPPHPPTPAASATPPCLNFALNLEYLEAEFYLRAATGEGLVEQHDRRATARAAGCPGGHKVPFKSQASRTTPTRSPSDEKRARRVPPHGARQARRSRGPTIDLDASFTAAAIAAGVIKKGQKFDPFANEHELPARRVPLRGRRASRRTRAPPR